MRSLATPTGSARYRYVGHVIKREITFDCRHLEELVTPRPTFGEMTGDSCRNFWNEHVHNHPSDALTTVATSKGWTLQAECPADAEGVIPLWKTNALEPSMTNDSGTIRALCVRDVQALNQTESRCDNVRGEITILDRWRINLYRLGVHTRLRRYCLARASVTETEQSLPKHGATRITVAVALRGCKSSLQSTEEEES